jgi:two-component system, chemotaxis family, chemotaxis protein CheY
MSPVSDYDLSNLHIMIVDCHVPMRRILWGILREWNINNIVEAVNGQEALDKMGRSSADVLITEYKMHPIDGLELTKTIRSGESGADPYLPIILISSYTEMKTILDARDAGANEFLAKPISAKLVYDRLRMIIENPRPFVRTEGFMGPDRRRHTQPLTGEDRRVTQNEAAEADVQPNVH